MARLDDLDEFGATLRAALGLRPYPPEPPFRSVSDLILDELRTAGPLGTGDLARRLDRSPPQISRRLARLRAAGAVRKRGGIYEVIT